MEVHRNEVKCLKTLQGGNGRAGIPTRAFVLWVLELSTIPHGGLQMRSDPVGGG